MSDPITPENTPTPETPATVTASEGAPAAEAPAAAAPEQRGGRDPRGGGRDNRRGGQRGGPRGQRRNEDEGGVESSLVKIYRCAKVVKGGRTFSFGALVVAGDRAGNVGIGYGKANEVPMAVEKATKDARRQMVKVPLKGNTIPHTIKGKHGSSGVILVPALPGTGVTAGKSVRPVLELAGITDILTKAYGSTSPKNLVKATIDALRRLQSREEVERDRNVKLTSEAKELVTA
ncbi:MAG: 30S ribosomal protein S5 [Tepidisphaeraceae bacterium]